MARAIVCDRCGQATQDDFTTKETEIPVGFGKLPIKVSMCVQTAGDDEQSVAADLCKGCAIEAAELHRQTLQTL